MAESISVNRKRRKNRRYHGKGALDIIEEAVHLVRSSPPAVFGLYYIGSLPFILALLYFWTDMIRNAFADRHCAEASLGLAFLFLWMKSWQAVFIRRLMTTYIRGIPGFGWSLRRIARLVVAQTIIQPWGMLLLPAALFLVVPFPWVYALFQNVMVFGDGDDNNISTVLKRSWQQTKLWPKQNVILIWLLSPWLLVVASALALVLVPFFSAAIPGTRSMFFIFGLLLFLLPLNPLGVIIAANVGVAIVLIPQLLKTFLGVETIFTLSSLHIMNTTFFAVVCSITYLCLDPLIKTAYALRCFYGEALQTGEDLRVELRNLMMSGKVLLSVLVMVTGLFVATPLWAAETTAEELDDSIRRVMRKVEYAWRMPREKLAGEEVVEEEEPTLLTRIFEKITDTLEGWGKTIRRWLSKIEDWLEKLAPRRSPSRREIVSDTGWIPRVQVLIFILLAAITCVLAVLLWRIWRRRRKQDIEIAVAEMAPRPDITDENMHAGELPEDGWLALAKELMEKGQLRLALRAIYLASLACLAENELLTIAKFKSDRDYERELKRREHAIPDLVTAFTENVGLFERVWYGMHAVTRNIITHFTANYKKIKAYAES